MNTFVKNITFLFRALFVNFVLPEGSVQDLSWLTEDNKESFLKENKEEVIAFLDKLDINKNGIIVPKEYDKDNYLTILWRIIRWLGESFDWSEDLNLEEYKSILQELSQDLDVVKVETSSESKGLSQEVNSNSIKEEKLSQEDSKLKTLEFNTSIENSFIGITTSKENRSDLLSVVDKSSLSNILSLDYTELEKLVTKLAQDLWSDPSNFTFRNDIGVRNYNNIIPTLKEAWYDIKWYLGNKEAAWVVMSIMDLYDTQYKLSQTEDFNQKSKIIFDYDSNWVLDNDVHFYTKEKQFFESIKTEGNFENLLSNLWYDSLESFNESFNQNYYSSRLEFKERLGIILSVELPIEPSLLLKSPTALKDYYEFRNEVLNLVSTEVDTNEKTKNLPQETKDLIKLQWVWVLVWNKTWVWASWDISWLTKDWIDSFQIWFVNWIYWIWVTNTYKLDDEGKYIFNAWLINLIPVVWITLTIKEWNISELNKNKIGEYENLFPNKIESSTKVSITWSTTLWFVKAKYLGINIDSIDEDTKSWIEKAKKWMKEVLDSTFDYIKSWKDFEETWLKDESWNKLIYERLSDLYKSGWDNYIESLKQWALNNYENSLYENSKWLNYAGFSLWLAYVSNFLPIPIVIVKWEYHSQDWWNKVKTWTYEQGLKDSSELNSSEKESSSSLSSSKYLEHWLDISEWLVDEISSYEKGFSWKTRYNSWASDLMDPNKDLETRWNGLLKLSTWVKALRDIDLNSFIKDIKTDNDKLVAVSLFSDYMKKAKNFDNWSIDSWNEKTEDFIEIDRKRRGWFDKIMWFSLQKEAWQYYEKLSSWKWNIWKDVIEWLVLDSTSSKAIEWDKKVYWIDTLFTNSDILTVNWEALLIPIIDSSKIEAFKNKISSNNNILPDIKENILSKIESWELELNYWKDSNWFDDRIILIEKSKWAVSLLSHKNQKQEIDEKIDVFHPTNKSFWVAWAIIDASRKNSKSWEKKPSEWPEDEPTSNPDQDVTQIEESGTPVNQVDTPIAVETPTETVPVQTTEWTRPTWG